MYVLESSFIVVSFFSSCFYGWLEIWGPAMGMFDDSGYSLNECKSAEPKKQNNKKNKKI